MPPVLFAFATLDLATLGPACAALLAVGVLRPLWFAGWLAAAVCLVTVTRAVPERSEEDEGA